MGEVIQFPLQPSAVDLVKTTPLFKDYKKLRQKYEYALEILSRRPALTADDPVIRYYAAFGFYAVERGEITLGAFDTRREAVIFLANYYEGVLWKLN